MTFEKWWEEYRDKALDPEEVRFLRDWFEEAFEAGRDAGWEDNDDITLCNAAANRGRE